MEETNKKSLQDHIGTLQNNLHDLLEDKLKSIEELFWLKDRILGMELELLEEEEQAAINLNKMIEIDPKNPKYSSADKRKIELKELLKIRATFEDYEQLLRDKKSHEANLREETLKFEKLKLKRKFTFQQCELLIASITLINKG